MMPKPLPPQVGQAYQFRHAGPPRPEALSRIKAELKVHGAVAYDLWLPETFYMPHVIHDDEHVMGTVYGRYEGGRGVLIATDQRVIFLDKKPSWLRCDEIAFSVVGGISRSKIGPVGVVTLHTRLGDYSLRTFNQKNADNFMDFIESRCLQNGTLTWD